MGILRRNHTLAENEAPQVPPHFGEAHFRRLSHCLHGGHTPRNDTTENDLLAAGWIACAPPSFLGASLRIGVTPAGRSAYAARTAIHRERRQPHESLIDSLAVHFRARLLVFRSPKIRDRFPDLFAIHSTRTTANLRPFSIEAKASRADALRDIRSEKWRSYLAFSERVYFACSDGILAPRDIPDPAGLILVAGETVRIAKRALRHTDHRFSLEEAMDLVFHLVTKQQAGLPTQEIEVEPSQ
jgi:hypothetical protein